MNKAVFLDRDGTINIDYGYVSTPEKFSFLPNAIEGLKELKQAGYLLIIVSNQSGIGRGYYTLEDYQSVTKKMLSELEKQKLCVTDCYFCPHSPESNCACRKPGTKMIEDAIKKWNIDHTQSFLIGDKETDIRAGNLSSLTTILITDQKKDFHQHFTAKDLSEAAKFILKNQS